MTEIKAQLDRIEAKLDTLLGKKKPNTKGIPKPPDKPLKYPAVLNDPKFKAAWAQWVQHRKEKRQKLTYSTAKKQIDFLERQAKEYGVSAAIDIIDRSIFKGWTGLFEKNEKGGCDGADETEGYFPG